MDDSFNAYESIPTALWLEPRLRQLNAAGQAYYILQKGNYASGLVLLKLITPQRDCALLSLERNFDNKLAWVNALDQEKIAEKDADDYIARSTDFDPDLWVVEIESQDLKNPFEDM